MIELYSLLFVFSIMWVSYSIRKNLSDKQPSVLINIPKKIITNNKFKNLSFILQH